MAELVLRLFGPPRIECDGSSVSLGRRKSMALLAYLAVTEQPHGRDVLATLLWPQLDQLRARAAVRRVLMDLRRTIGPSWFVVQQDRIALPAQEGLRVDVVRFRHLLQAVEQHGHEPYHLCDPCVVALTEAANLYHGDFLAGFSLADTEEFDLWRTFEAENLQRDLATVLEKLAYVHGEEGRHQYELAIAYARRWLSLDPLHEPAQRALMQLYAWAGDRTAALHQYHECVRLLAAELGVEPAAETTELNDRIRRGEATVSEFQASSSRFQVSGSSRTRHSDSAQAWNLETVEPETSSPHGRRLRSSVTNNLPAQATPFIGRLGEMEQIAQRLADVDCRLLAIVGPGGMGKTRLAIEAALAQTGSFRHGVHLVDLAPVASADLLATTILRSLNAPQLGAADPRQRLCDFLQQKQMLLLLDNFEHLLNTVPRADSEQQADTVQQTDPASEGAGLLPQILHAAPGIKLLVTSRERLNLREEWLQPLQGLETPPGAGSAAESTPVPALKPGLVDEQQSEKAPDLKAYDATRLFLLCMLRLRPEDSRATDAALSEEERAAIAAICRLLEGMPLGIELAAAWTRALPLVEIQGEMERSLHFLSAPLRNVPARHRSMHAVFDHSWQLLSQHQQNILRRMSVFRGGSTRRAAEEVTEAALADLSDLVDRSWLRLRGNGRYGMHELMRQYCEEKLEDEHAEACGETAAQVRRRHCAYFGAYMHASVQKTNFRREAIHEIMAEFGNMQAAWRCAIDTIDVAVAFDICMIIFFAGDMMGWYRFSIQTLETAAVRLEMWLGQEDLIAADEAGVLQVLANIRHAQAHQYGSLGLLEEANTCAERLCALVERMEAGEARAYWHMLSRKSRLWLLFDAGNFDATRCLAQELLVCYEDETFRYLLYGDKLGRAFWQASAYAALGHMYWALGNYAEAEQMYERCMTVRDEVGEKRFKATNLGDYSRLVQILGDHSRAEELARQGLHLSEGVGDRIGTAMGHLAVGRVLMVQGHYDRARVHLAQSQEMGRQSGRLSLLMDSLAELGRSELDEGHPDRAKRLLEEALQAFRTVGTAHINNLVAVWLGLGWTAVAKEALAEARPMFGKALCARGRAAVETMDGIAGMGRVLILENRLEEAVELFALVAHHRFTAHALRQKAEEWLQELERELPAQVYNKRVAAGRRDRLDDVVADLFR